MRWRQSCNARITSELKGQLIHEKAASDPAPTHSKAAEYQSLLHSIKQSPFEILISTICVYPSWDNKVSLPCQNPLEWIIAFQSI